MIEFACQHCANVMKADDHDSGRGACCPACRRFIILPQVDGGGGDVFLLSSEERCTRMEKMLRFMAENAQRTEALLAPYRDAQVTPLADRTAPPHAENLSETEEHSSDVLDLQSRLERALTECEARRVAFETAEAHLEERTADVRAERSLREAAEEALETAEAGLEQEATDMAAERSLREAAEETLETAEAGLAQQATDMAAERALREAAEEALETAEAGLAQQATDMAAERALREAAEEALETADATSIRGNSELKEELAAMEDRVTAAQAERDEALGALTEERTQREQQRVASDEVTAALQHADEQLLVTNARVAELEIRLEAAAGEAGADPRDVSSDDESQETAALLPELMDAEDERDGDVLTQAYLRFLNPS